MATLPKKKKRKKMVDISQPVPVRVKEPKAKKIKESEEEKFEKELEKLDEKLEKFEKSEEKRFKEEDLAGKRFRMKFRLKKPRRVHLFITLLIILLAAGVYSAIEFLPKVDIKIITKKTEWNYVDSVTAAKSAVQIDAGEKQIPAEIFSIKKNFTFSFPASGKKMVEEKAFGKIIIYNAYSSDSQPLVANTRFVDSDGKVFRLIQKIVVPGAKIVEGKIVPSSIEAAVAADKAGPAYNIGPTSYFSIPGFQGSAKYQGFYAESKQAMTGGFIGERAYPTDEDVKKAKDEALIKLKDLIESFLGIQIPPEFKVIEGSSQFSLLRQEVNTKVDEKNQFTVFSEAESLTIAFKESDFENLMEKMVRAESGKDALEIKTYELEYGAARSDFKEGQISFAVDFRGIFEEPVDVDGFRENALNKKEKELKEMVSSLSGIQKATISFWPFWVKSAPENLKRIKIEAE